MRANWGERRRKQKKKPQSEELKGWGSVGKETRLQKGLMVTVRKLNVIWRAPRSHGKVLSRGVTWSIPVLLTLSFCIPIIWAC